MVAYGRGRNLEHCQDDKWQDLILKLQVAFPKFSTITGNYEKSAALLHRATAVAYNQVIIARGSCLERASTTNQTGCGQFVCRCRAHTL